VVFGRVSPEDKRGLIQALQADGHGVAMIGDGVNDIPALKTADCSIAMAGGSDAACRVAQITLLNADFDIMPGIVLEGRRVINNITRASSLFLVKNIFSLVLSVLLMVLPFAYPFAPIQLTLVSSLTIGAPSFVLALQPSRERVKGNFLQNVIKRALPGGLCAAVLLLGLMAVSPALGLTADELGTLSTLIAGYSGLVVLLLTCMPLNALRAGLLDQRLKIGDLIIALGAVRVTCQQVLMSRAVGMTVQIESDQLRVRLQIRADDGDQVFVSVERGVIVDGTDVHEDIDTFLLQRIAAGLVCYI
jgi:cation-transporting ATPase E